MDARGREDLVREVMSHLSGEEEEELRQALKSGGDPLCPRCGTRLRRTPVPPRSDVAYVRRRVALHCRSCRQQTVIDFR